MTGLTLRRLLLAGAALAVLTGCQEGTDGAGPITDTPPADGAVASATSVKLVDRDTEAPEIFQTTDMALWDGRPSLGGVWVASPEAKDPERVIMRNPANGKFVIGALFRRERDNPGPTLQISSDAAAALGMLAGAPVKISVTALRRDEGTQTAPSATAPLLDAAETVESETADPIATTAAAAIDKAAGKPAKDAAATATVTTTAIDPAQPAAAKAAPAATTTAPPAAAAGTGKLIQIGIFSQEANAKRAAETLKKAGIAAEIRTESSQGKPFWSVTSRGDAAALAKIKGAGFSDAYFLKG